MLARDRIAAPAQIIIIIIMINRFV